MKKKEIIAELEKLHKLAKIKPDEAAKTDTFLQKIMEKDYGDFYPYNRGMLRSGIAFLLEKIKGE